MNFERKILGSILLNNKNLVRLSPPIRVHWFEPLKHQLIFGAMKFLAGKDEPIDLITLTNHLKQNHILDQAGGPSYLASLIDELPNG